MILKKTKQLINEFRAREEVLKKQNEKIIVQNENIRKQNELLISQCSELEWANIYHDAIRDKEWLEILSLSPGRWAVNYSFLYVLVRILTDCRPNKILELGLGESTKIVSSFLDNYLAKSTHLIIEQDLLWIDDFSSRFELSPNSNITHLELETKIVNNKPVKSYSSIENKITESFDFYIVDGPFGSANFSRYDICLIADKIELNDEFIILIDDYNRLGEQETANSLIKLLTEKGIETHVGSYFGIKGQIVIATKKYRFVTSF
jgi:hypothetical protein